MGIKVVAANELKQDELSVAEAARSMLEASQKVVEFMDVLEIDFLRELVREGALYCICNEVNELLGTFYIRISNIESEGRQVYVMGGGGIMPGKAAELLSEEGSLLEQAEKILRKYDDHVVIGSTHARFSGAAERLGFKYIDMDTIRSERPELLEYFGKKEHPGILRYVRE